MPRIENIKEPGYYFIVPKKNIPKFPVVEVSPNLNNQIILDKEVPHPRLFKEEEIFKYDIPRAKLLPPSIADLNKDIKYVTLNKNKEIIEHKIPQVAPNENKAAPYNKGIAMVKPMTSEGNGNKDIAMVKPMTSEGNGNKDIAMVKPMTLEGNGNKGIAMVKPMTSEGNGNKDIAMVKPMTLEGNGNKGIAMVKPMFKEELIPSNRPGVTWSKGVVLSKYPMVQGADLMESLKEHWEDTIRRMTTGFAEDIKDWMRQKRESLKKDFHNFVSKTMRDYENAIMDPARTLVQNAIKNPLGTISEFPKNIKNTFNDVGQGILNTTVDTGVTIGNKAVDTLNAGIAMGNTGVEALNTVNSFFGGKGKSLPLMKTIPRIPSREELLQQATMKGGSLAKMGAESNFDVGAFKDAANAGKIDRSALINASSTPVFNNSLPDDYAQWSGIPLWFTLQEDNVAIDEKNPPIILDNTGRETEDRNKEGRKIGEKSYNYMGYREGPFKSAMEGIYRGVLGFQGQPDIVCDINIEPHKYVVQKTSSSGGMGQLFYPPKYPIDELGDFMISDFEVQYLTMNTEDTWNLGVYGNIPLVVNYILPTSLSIRFVGDANLKVAKWLQAYREYMTGYTLSLHSVRPHKMNCQEITCYALSFYGEVVHAMTFYAYPLMKESYSMFGSGGIKHYDTDWVIVGLREFHSKPSLEIPKLAPQNYEESESTNPSDIVGISGDDTNATVEENESGVSVTLKTNSVDVQEGDVKNAEEHVEKFLDKTKTSQNVVNALKDVSKNESIRALAEKAGLGKVIGELDKLSDLDLFVRTGCNYIVCAYTNHIASPSFKDTNIPYNSTNLTAEYKGKSVLRERFNRCDELAKKRAKEYVQSLLTKGVSKDNIKVILASCDGIPGMNHYISGTVMTHGFYLGGIHQYTKAECEMESGDGNTPGLLKNRRVDLIFFDDFVEKYPDAIDEMMGKGSSDARGNRDKLKLLWNRIPKVSYGRDMFWGPSYPSASRFPTLNSKDIDLGINGFSSPGTKLVNTDKETNEEKYENIKDGAKDNNEIVNSGLGTEKDLEKSIEDYKKGEEYKGSIDGVDTREYGKEYTIRDTIKYVNAIDSINDNAWFNRQFGKKYKKYIMDGKYLRLGSLYTNQGEPMYLYLSEKAGKLPQSTTNPTLYPVINLLMTPSLFEQNAFDMLTIKMYFRTHDYAWIYFIRSDELRFYQKVDINK